ncbi:hypothetical protein D3C78_1164130 [compost metagenome]
MEAVAAHAVFLVEEVRHRVAVGVLGHALVEGGVEHADLRQAGEQCHGGFDADQVGRVVQRRQLGVGTDALEHVRVDQAGGGEVLAAVHHAMADAVELATGRFLGQRQHVVEDLAMVGARQVQAFLGVTQLPVDHGFRAAEAFGQALQGEGRLRFVDQGELQRRAAAVDDQNIAGGHGGS